LAYHPRFNEPRVKINHVIILNITRFGLK
jgi:hypothetical protein